MTASDKILPGLLLATALLASACAPPRPEGAARGPALYETCSACHGADGMGEQLAEAPALVGLSDWYLKAQLGKFQAGIRGTHHEDVEGLRMRPMSKALEEEGDVDTVVAHIVAMPKGAPAATLEGGRADKGQALYAVCAACHGMDGKGVQASNGPALVNLNDWYLLTQLKKLKSGVRGSNPADITGQQMAPMAATLADEQAMKDVIAFIQTLRK